MARKFDIGIKVRVKNVRNTRVGHPFIGKCGRVTTHAKEGLYEVSFGKLGKALFAVWDLELVT